jgi:FkbM family methyltransferase
MSPTRTVHPARRRSTLSVRVSRAAWLYRHEGTPSLVRQLWSVATRRYRERSEERSWNRLTLDATDLRVDGVQGFSMLVSSHDSGISRELALYRVHEPAATAALRSLIRPGSRVLDIGANIGYYALLESRIVGPEGKILAVEPSPTNACLLRRNVELNSAENVAVFECAVGAQDGVGSLHLSSHSNLNSMIRNPELDHTSSVAVALRSVDSIVDETGINPDLVRMDIEGYETEALAGMAATLDRQRPHLVIELHPQICGPAAIEALLRDISARGYRLRCIVDRSRDYAWSDFARATESLAIEALIADLRLLSELRQFSVFLSHCEKP